MGGLSHAEKPRPEQFPPIDENTIKHHRSAFDGRMLNNCGLPWFHIDHDPSVLNNVELISFLQFQQTMMENFAKLGGANQLNNIQGLQGGANNNSNNPPQKKEEYINICFSTVKGSRILMNVKPDETVEKVLEKYLLRVELPDLINKIDGKIGFIFSAQSLKFGDKRKIKDVMIIGGGLNQILVNDTKDLIGAF